MSSFIILYNGQRKTIKAAPNALIQSVLNEAAEKFGLDPKKCSLLHKKINIDNSQSVRFCGIPNLAQIELQLNGSTQSVGSQCRIALSVMNGTSCTGSFPAAMTLSAVLMLFVEEGSLQREYLNHPFEIIYLRTAVTGDALQSTTLGDLGLTGQGGRLQFRHFAASVVALQETDSPTVTMTMDVDVSSSLPKEVQPGNQEVNESEAIYLKTEQCSELMDTVNDTNAAIVLVDEAIKDDNITKSKGESPNTIELKSSHIMSPEIEKSTAVKNVVSIKQTSEIGDVSNPINNPKTTTVKLSSVSEYIDRLLTQNFDRVSGPCIITIVKYVLNIMSDPSDPKYRTVSTVNKTFKEKVATASAAGELMHSLGFKEVPGSNTLCNAATADELKATLTLLESAMDRLQIAPADRPRPKVTVNPRAQTEVPMPEWDPYQSSIVRTAPQPSRGGKSVTEVALEKLQARKRELEGTPESVERRTEVLLPLPDGSTPSIQDYLNSITAVDAEEESGPSDSTLIARSLASKLRESRGADDEDEPMTTAAVRELRKLQKEKIYTHTLLRVKFPDRVCIQGYFHLRHSVLDVYEWVRSSLSSEEGKSNEKESGSIVGQRKNESGADFFQLFELYTSPPRCVLHPYAKSSSEDAYRFSDMGGSTEVSARYLSLADARLVPAALLHLSWGPAHPNYSDRSLISSSFSSSSSSSSSASSEEVSMIPGISPVPLGQYLCASLLSKAVSKENATLNSAASVPSLVETSAPPLTSNSIDSKGVVEGTKGDSGDRPQGKESKPKWLKIGK